MISEDDKDVSSKQNTQESGQTPKICVRKIPGLSANPISVVVSSASTTKQPGDAPNVPITVPIRTVTKSLLTVKTGEWFSQNKNIFMKDGKLYMKCANSNKIVELQVAKAVPASSAQGSEFKLLPVSVKNLAKDIKISPKPAPTEAETTSSVTALQVFKPIAKAPLTDAPTVPAKPQPEVTQVNPIRTDKAEVRAIQITNLPTGTILDFKGPSYGISSRFPSLQDTSKESSDSKVFNVQISNGRLSDPNGPIKMLGHAGKSLTVSSKGITINSDGTICADNPRIEAKEMLMDEKVVRTAEKTPRKIARSSSTDETPKKTPTSRRLSEPLRTSDRIEETPKPQEKATFESLLCNESLENSSDGEKSEKSPIREHQNGLLDPLQVSDSDPDRHDHEFSERSLSQRSTNCQLMKLTTRREGEDEDPLNLIRWEDGIGYLYGSNLHFQFNELGLVDIMDDDEFMRYQQTESHYDQPICDRELNPLRMRQLQTTTEPIYTCLSCSCSGLAADFLAPDYCSKACINISKRRSRVETDEEGKHSSTKRKSKDNAVFPWKDYLASTNSQRAPDELFPHWNSDIFDYYAKHPFRVQTKLEAIDPDNCSVFGVVTILAVQGQRMLLHFDGCPVKYDFWVNFNNSDIFPPRWCEHEGKNLIVPRSGQRGKFVWHRYLEETKCEAAKLKNFRSLAMGGYLKVPHGFKAGMKLEAENVKGTGKLTVATVADVIGDRVRIHFDGHSDNNDYWCNYDSPRLHPLDFHKTVKEEILAPTRRSTTFSWSRYLHQTNSQGVPDQDFVERPPRAFRKGMKLEAVDRVCPEFIRPATVIDIVGYELRILYDGFDTQYAYWVDDDSTDIFPTGYCEITGHPLEAVPSNRWPVQGCGLKVCSGKGSVTNQWEKNHEAAIECPYNTKNYNHRAVKPCRLNAKHIVTHYALRFSLVRKRKFGVTLENERPHKATSLKRPRKTAPMVERKVARTTQDTPEASTSQTPSVPASPSKDTRAIWKSTSTIRSHIELGERKQVNPLLWSTNEVVNFLSNLPNCSHIAERFRKEDIDGEAFIALSKDDLTNLLDIKLGPAIKLYNLIVKLRSDINDQFLQF